MLFTNIHCLVSVHCTLEESLVHTIFEEEAILLLLSILKNTFFTQTKFSGGHQSLPI